MRDFTNFDRDSFTQDLNHRDFLKKTKSPASSFMFKPVTAREVELEI